MNDELLATLLFGSAGAIPFTATWLMVERRYRGPAVAALVLLGWCLFRAGWHYAGFQWR